jgi:septum formation protein
MSYVLAFHVLLVQVVVSSFDENLPKNGLTGAEYAVRTAAEKALDVTRSHAMASTADLVIGADTVVECDGILFEKPLDESDAFYMIKKLSGNFHTVHTGVALVIPQKTGAPDKVEFAVSTKVKFAELTDGEIEAYIKTKEPFGKAGAYGIQGVAAAFVVGVEGCYNNVVGLPTHSLAARLKHLIDSGRL